MNKNCENTYEDAKVLNTGFSNGDRGFVGCFSVTKRGVEVFERDRWCAHASYEYIPFTSTKKEFIGKCFKKLSEEAPADIFDKMTDFNVTQYYVPMVYKDGWLFSLHSKWYELNYLFFNNSSFASDIYDISEKKPVVPEELPFRDVEYLSIYITPIDIQYVANIKGVQFNPEIPFTVVLLPIHCMKFKYKNNDCWMMSIGDAELSHFTYNNLPSDPILSCRKLVYSKPWIWATTVFIAILITIWLLYSYLFSPMWNWFEMEPKYRIIPVGFVVFLAYFIAWVPLRLFAVISYEILGSIEKFTCKQLQRNAYRRNFQTKQIALKDKFQQISVDMPDASTYPIDTTLFTEWGSEILERVSEGPFKR